MQDYPPMVSKNLSEAIYGDEHWAVDKNGDSKMYRSSNGFFHGEESKNTTVVCAFSKKEGHRKISFYRKYLYFKHVHEDAGDSILELFDLDRIISSQTYMPD
jgi:hypothetical protein